MKGKIIIKAIAYLLAVLLVVAAVGVVYRLTNGFNEELKTFYVEHDGKQILSSDTKLNLYCCTTQKFTVKYTFDTAQSETKDYSVTVLPNAEKDFEFTVDGQPVKFSKAENLNTAFELKKDTASFTIRMPDLPKIQSVLEKAYAGKEIGLPEAAEENNPHPFVIEVASYNGKIKYKIAIALLDAGITEIELDKTHIVFGAGDTA